jgi:ATP-dependent exoDNAse (exonuclease V) beta subunit
VGERVNFQSKMALQYQSLAGSLIHQYLENSVFNPSQKMVKNQLIERGFSGQHLNQQTHEILEILHKTQNDKNFDFLFKPRDSTQTEATFVFNQQTLVIDRLFIEKGILWIVDFKTSTLQENESIKVFIKRQQNAHKKQLFLYKKALMAVYKIPIKCLLYCPQPSLLIEITH